MHKQVRNEIPAAQGASFIEAALFAAVDVAELQMIKFRALHEWVFQAQTFEQLF